MRELCDWSLPELREWYSGFNTDYKPTKGDVLAQTKGKTKGELIEGILTVEFPEVVAMIEIS